MIIAATLPSLPPEWLIEGVVLRSFGLNQSSEGFIVTGSFRAVGLSTAMAEGRRGGGAKVKPWGSGSDD